MIKFPGSQQTESEPQHKNAVLELIPIERIRPNPYQPRKHFEEERIEELASSIRQIGLLQPINVRKTGKDDYELIAGERRLRACKRAGYTHIRALVTTTLVDKDIAMIAMIENLQRENLHFFEEAEGYQSLIREHGFTQEELAKRLSKNQSTIANKLRILRLSRQVKDRIVTAGLTERHARALLRLHDEPAQMRLIEQIVEAGLSVKMTEELVEAELRTLYGEEPKEKKAIHIKCNHSIYINTLRRCVSKIKDYGVETDFNYQDKGDHMEVVIKLMKQ